eukprot:NODE_281_length_11904_cov_0.253452.p4 type:complete len:204 gc:universal NODE_281_length_11904_cov_0.253452:10980-10369(-)
MSKNLRVLNLKVNLKGLQNDFLKLKQDPYIKEGYRWKHIVRFRLTNDGLVKAPHGPLFQSSKFNPTHGNLTREYPEYSPNKEAMKVIKEFVQSSGAKVGDEILVQAQRVTCSKDLVGLPSVEDWHRDGVKAIGLFSVSRGNIKGGVSEFRDKSKKVFFSQVLEPGKLAIFADEEMEHRVTPITVEKPGEGYRDVMLLAHPANR